MYQTGFPSGTSEKESICQCRRRERHGFDTWVSKIPWRRKWQPTSVFHLGNPMDRGSGGLQSMGYKQSDTTKHACTQALRQLGCSDTYLCGQCNEELSPDRYPFHCPKLTSTKLHAGLAQVEKLIIIFEVGFMRFLQSTAGNKQILTE